MVRIDNNLIAYSFQNFTLDYFFDSRLIKLSNVEDLDWEDNRVKKCDVKDFFS